MDAKTTINICSADHFFTEGGAYNFIGLLLPEAHAKCKKTFKCFLERGVVKHPDLECFGIPEYVKPDMAVAIMGPSGIGKSTFIKTVIPQLYPGKRVIVLDNTNVLISSLAWYNDTAELNGVPFYIIKMIPEGWKNFDIDVDADGRIVTDHVLREFINLCVERNAHNVPRKAIEQMFLQMRQNEPFFPTRYNFKHVVVRDSEWAIGIDTFALEPLAA